MYFSKVYLSKVYFCEIYPTCVSSKLCEFIVLSFGFNFYQNPKFFRVCKRSQHTMVNTKSPYKNGKTFIWTDFLFIVDSRKQEEMHIKDLQNWNVSGIKGWQELNWKLRFDQNPIYPTEFTSELLSQTFQNSPTLGDFFPRYSRELEKQIICFCSHFKFYNAPNFCTFCPNDLQTGCSPSISGSSNFCPM